MEEVMKITVGVDEAGRGPLAGPVVAAAVILKNQELGIKNQDASKHPLWNLVRDSKKLSAKQRERAFEFIQEHFFVGVGIIHSETIDRVNILEATFLAMRAAVSELQRIMNQELRIKNKNQKLKILVDGNQKIPNVSEEQAAIVDGDAKVKVISAASIIAKVTRDRMMDEYDREFPWYGFAKHKGYGTKLHMDALRKFGPCPIHRMSFRPVFLSIPENANKRFFGK